jgi:hypothetical protein
MRIGFAALGRSAGMVAVVVGLSVCSSAFASSMVTESTIDSGGLHTTSANYAIDNSVGGIGGISSASADTAKYGYIGQLTEVVSITVTAQPNLVAVAATSQLSGTATLNDSTVARLSGSDIIWSSLNEPYPVASIGASGVLSPAGVYMLLPTVVDGVVNGYYLGATNSMTVGVYATDSIGDGIADWWRAQYFPNQPPGNSAGTATNNVSCATGDADGTGQDNYFKFVAGLNPTNPSSIFVLRIAPVRGQPTQKALTYGPVLVGFGQTYAVQFTTNLVGGVYMNLTDYSGPQNTGTQATVTDLNATQRQKFYRVNISLP